MKTVKSKSNNYGQPIKDVVVPTVSQMVALIEEVKYSGKVFRVDFTKRSDGSKRTMIARCGVKSELKGGKRPYKFSNKGLLSVYEFGSGYKTVPLDNVTMLKIGGVAYFPNAPVSPGSYGIEALPIQAQGKRTLPAHTSPMYNEQV